MYQFNCFVFVIDSTIFRSWQTITFTERPVSFIKIIGTKNTSNEVSRYLSSILLYKLVELLVCLFLVLVGKKNFRKSTAQSKGVK